jgi:GNAT superfamily N-acetyltransferase
MPEVGAGRFAEVIRGAEVADAAHIRGLMNSVAGFWDAGWPPDVPERVLRSSETIALVHLTEEVVDGFACAHDAGFRGYLSELVVSRAAQRRGIGSRLLAEVERRLAGRGCTVVIADVWRDAEAFYRANGWSPPSVVLLRKRLVP